MGYIVVEVVKRDDVATYGGRKNFFPALSASHSAMETTLKLLANDKIDTERLSKVHEIIEQRTNTSEDQSDERG